MENKEIANPEALPENQTPGAEAAVLPIVYVDPALFKLEAVEASEIEKAFIPQLEKMRELEAEYLAIIDESPDDPEVGKKADTLRKKYVKVRTETDKIHRKQKDYYLNGGRFVDAWEKTQETVSKIKEDKLASITNHAKIEAEKQRAELEKDRIELLRPVLELPSYAHLQLGTMATDVFYAYLKTTQEAHAERVSKEQKEKEEREAAALKTKAFNERNASILKYSFLWNSQTPGYVELTPDTTPEEWLVIRDRVIVLRDAWIVADQKRKDDAAQLQKENDELKAKLNNPAPSPANPEAFRHTTPAASTAGSPAPSPLAAAVSSAIAGATIPLPEQPAPKGDAENLAGWLESFQLPQPLGVYKDRKYLDAHVLISEKFNGFLVWAESIKNSL